MTNQPTNNGWIDDLYDIAVLDLSFKRNEFRHYIEDNLPKPTEVVAPVEAIMEDMFGDFKDSSESFCLIPNIVRHKLQKHLKGTTPVEPINQERVSAIKKKYKKRLTTDSIDVNYVIYKQVYNEFLDDITSLQSSEEKVEGE